MKHTHIIIAIDGLTASITLLSYNGSGLTVLFWDVGCIQRGGSQWLPASTRWKPVAARLHFACGGWFRAAGPSIS